MSKIFNCAVVATLLSTAAAHTYVENVEIGGVSYPGFYQGTKQDPGNNSPAWWTNQGWGYQPIYGSAINDPDIIAHKDASPSPFTVDAPAGSQVTFTWTHKGSCNNDEVGWDCSHHGWSSVWMAPCGSDSCANVDKTQLKFFKIAQEALIDYRSGRYSQGEAQEQKGYWGTDRIFYDQDNKQYLTLPKELPNGGYVLRTEVVSIHNNGGIANRQFWPQAFNIKITGGDDSAPVPSGVLGTQIYQASDALLNYDLYWHTAGQTFADSPGPALAAVAISDEAESKTVSSRAVHRHHARHFSTI